MCIGYDPFKWADNYESEEEYIKELEMENKIEIDLDAITTEYDSLLDAKARYKFELAQVEKRLETLDLQLIALLNQTGTDEMQYGIYKFGWIVKQRTALDQKYLKEHFADIAQKCTFTKESKNFDFKIYK